MTDIRFEKKDDTTVAVRFGRAEAGTLQVGIVRAGNNTMHRAEE